jgi:GDP-mannose 6-dehydrogenase
VSLARLVGANREYIEREIPHIASLLVTDFAEVVSHGEVLVIGNAAPLFKTLPAHWRSGQIVLDLAWIPGLRGGAGVDYRGIAW